jgi:hypothetical protein
MTRHPPPRPPDATAEIAEIDARLDRLADLIARVAGRQAYTLRRRWLQIAYQRWQLARGR